ncbi:MAG: hypothetical protein HY908_37450 [Myxococcales bacterium]|nr:hypothetical protein [Myxococcales bacterium]
MRENGRDRFSSTSVSAARPRLSRALGVVIAVGVSTGACSLALKTKSAQCESDADCVALGTEFAGKACREGLCVDAAAPGWSAIVDACPVPASAVISSEQAAYHSGTIPLNGLADDIQNCYKLTGFDGPDGILAVEIAAGEKVYLEAELVALPGAATPPVDLGVYTMSACDPATCFARVERCPAGKAESQVLRPDIGGTYYWGFDTKAYDEALHQPTVKVTVVYPRCGDGALDPGESCDDGNSSGGDGCSPDCLAELAMNGGVIPVEREPNNYYEVANSVLFEPGSTTIDIKGFLGGGCDLDFFEFDVPAGGFARVTMLGQDGQDCPASTPPFSLEFDDPTGTAELGSATIPADTGGTNYCPQFDETSFPVSTLPGGRYIVELKPFQKGDHPIFPYLLRIQILDPGAGTGGQ